MWLRNMGACLPRRALLQLKVREMPGQRAFKAGKMLESVSRIDTWLPSSVW